MIPRIFLCESMCESSHQVSTLPVPGQTATRYSPFSRNHCSGKLTNVHAVGQDPGVSDALDIQRQLPGEMRRNCGSHDTCGLHDCRDHELSDDRKFKRRLRVYRHGRRFQPLQPVTRGRYGHIFSHKYGPPGKRARPDPGDIPRSFPV